MDKARNGHGGAMASLYCFLKNISILIGTNFCNFIQQNYIFPPLNNVINSFKSNVIVTNFFIIFLQTIEVANFY